MGYFQKAIGEEKAPIINEGSILENTNAPQFLKNNAFFFSPAKYAIKKFVKPLWEGNKGQLGEIEQGIADAQNSPYNTAKVSEQGQAFYDNSFKDYLKYQKLAESGLSQAEKDLATGQFAKAQNFAQQNSLNQGGGNLAPYINTVLNSNANDFSVNLAAKDAEAKRQNAQLALSYLNNLGQGAEQFNRASNLNFEKQTMAEQVPVAKS